MIRSELIRRLAQVHPLPTQRDMERIVGTVFETITEALCRGDRVELRGFGSYTVRRRDARVGRNPRTGEAVAISTVVKPHFKVSRKLHDRLNAAAPSTAGGNVAAGPGRAWPTARGSVGR